MWGLIVVLGLVAVVILVGVLVALGMRASRAGGDDDWMAEDEQPRGRRGGRSRGRRGDDELEEEPYGDMRVAGAPLGQHQHQQLPAAPYAGPHASPAPLPAAPAPVPVPASSGRSSDEMDDDEYWSTITFDKPKFPWRQNAEQPAESRGHDPLAPSSGPGQGPGAPAPPTAEQRAVGPIDTPAPPTAPQPAIPSNPLDAPVGRANETDPGAIPSYGSAEQSGGFSLYGSEPSSSGFGDDPLNTGERPVYSSPPSVPQPAPPPPPAPAPSAPSAVPMASSSPGADDDPHRLPSVDELLAKIQSDRKKAAGESEPAQPSFDPLTDPLNTGERPLYGSSSPYGSSPSTPPSPSPSTGGSWSPDYGSDPLSGGYSSSGSAGGGYGSSGYDGGYGSSGYSSGDSSSSGYSSDSSYGSSAPHQEDPLGTGYAGSSSESYGSYGTKNDPPSGGYSDYSGNGYGGSGYGDSGSSSGYGDSGSSSGYGDSGSSGYGDSGYYASPGNGQGYDSGAPGSERPEDNSTQAYPTSPYGNSYGTGNRDDKQDKRPEDWNSYGDYRH
jgi:hypothetical protein